MSTHHNSTSSNLNTKQEDVINLGWPRGVRLPYSQSGSYLIGPPHPSRRMQYLFLGPYLSHAHEACFLLIVDQHTNPNSRSSYDGLCISAYRSAWSPNRADRVLRAMQRVGRYLELRIWDPTTGIEMVTRFDAEFGGHDRSSFVSGPVDNISKSEEVQRVRGLPNWVSSTSCHLLPPLRPDMMVKYVTGIMDILRSAKLLCRCSLPLDLFMRLVECLRILSKYTKVDELELTLPVSFDLFSIIHPGGSNNSRLFLEALLKYLSRLEHLQSLRIPVALVTPEVLNCIARLPKLRHLSVKPAQNVFTFRRFLRAMEDARIPVQGPNCDYFRTLAFLDLGSNNAEYQQQRDARHTLRSWLPKTLFHGESSELQRLNT